MSLQTVNSREAAKRYCDGQIVYVKTAQSAWHNIDEFFEDVLDVPSCHKRFKLMARYVREHCIGKNKLMYAVEG